MFGNKQKRNIKGWRDVVVVVVVGGRGCDGWGEDGCHKSAHSKVWKSE